MMWRPGVVAGVLALYSVGKYFAALDCVSGSNEDGSSSSCARVETNYNWDYNWTGVAFASAIGILSIDVFLAQRRETISIDRAWPMVSAMPVKNGGGLAVSGTW